MPSSRETTQRVPGEFRERMLDVFQTAAMTGMSVEWVRKASRDGRFPRPLKFGRASRWRESSVVSFIAAHDPCQA
jgi:predicted DNA-binding transcriptional regulator AlpA